MNTRHSNVVRNSVLVAAAVFSLVPLAIPVISSFGIDSHATWPVRFGTLRWYREALDNPKYIDALYFSVDIAGISSAMSVASALLACYGISRSRSRIARVVEPVLMAPLSLPRVVVGFNFFAAYALIAPELYGTTMAVVLAHVLITLPFAIALVGPGFDRASIQLEEAARTLGRSAWGAMWSAVFPVVRIPVLLALVFCFWVSFDEVDASVFLIPPNSSTLPVTLLYQLEENQSPTAAAMSSILTLAPFGLVVAGVLWWNQRERRRTAISSVLPHRER